MSKNDDWWNITQKVFWKQILNRARKKQFWWNWLNSLPDCIKVSTQCPEFFLKNSLNPGKKFFFSPLLRRKELWKHCRKTIANWRINIWLILWEKYMKTDIFSQSTNFLKKTLLKRRMLFRQLCLTPSTKWLKVICPMSENHEK